jgi:sorting nexin-29
MEQIWAENSMPAEWNQGIICPLHKKGDQLNCTNYRGITLLNTGYKVLSNILFQRLLPYAESIIGHYQCGFRPSKSCTDQIHTLRLILEKTQEFNIDTHHLFIDFRSAYDSIDRRLLFTAMREFSIPEKLVCLTEMTMANVECRVKIQSDLSNSFETHKGLRQGDALACLLFNLALEKVVRDSGINTNGTIFYKSVQLLAYADDIDIISRDINSLRQAFTSLDRAAKLIGLNINEDKTKYLFSSTTSCTVPPPLNIDGYTFEPVESFVYLGSMITNKNDLGHEVRRRITAANKSYFGLQNHLKNKRLSRATKFLLYKTLIRPVLTYSAECWATTKNDERQLDIFERKVLRRICGPVCDGGNWRIRYNHEIYNLYGDVPVTKYVKVCRLRWLGHLARMEDDLPAKKVWMTKPEGRRRVGRPKLRWGDCCDRDLKAMGVTGWGRRAQNREDWRRLIEEAKTHPGL